MNRESMEAILQKIKDYHRIILFRHFRPDGDAVGSAFALRSVLVQMGMQVRCLCANAVPARLRFLTSDAEDAVEEEALPEAFRQEDVAVISVDTASPAQMGALAEHWQERVMLMIDHHETGTPYAPALIDPAASATGELIYALAQELIGRGCIQSLSLQTCTALYAAISSDTGSFRYSNVTERTFLIAAALRAQSSCGDKEASCSSGVSLTTTVKSTPSRAKSSRRRGD